MTGNQDKNLPGGEIEQRTVEEEPNFLETGIIQKKETQATDKIETVRIGEAEAGQHLPRAETEQTGDTGGGPVRPEYNFLDLIYGVLFDPGKTFKKVAANPPLWQSVLIYGIITVLSSVMGIFINLRAMPVPVADYSMLVMRIIQGMLPVVALFFVLLQFVKWFSYSALLHLMADFYGGKGTARGVFTVYGLAGLPTLFIIPVQLLALAVIPGNAFLKILIFPISLALSIWGIILLVMGIREVHGFSTGRAVLVVFTPVLVVAVLMVIAIVAFVAITAYIPSQIHWPSF